MFQSCGMWTKKVLTLILEFSLKNKTVITILEEDSLYIQSRPRAWFRNWFKSTSKQDKLSFSWTGFGLVSKRNSYQSPFNFHIPFSIFILFGTLFSFVNHIQNACMNIISLYSIKYNKVEALKKSKLDFNFSLILCQDHFDSN